MTKNVSNMNYGDHPSIEAKPAQHTPGPWKLIDQTRIQSESFGLIASVRGEITPHYETEANANARLIAAAPETAAERDKLKALNAELVEALHLIYAQSLGSDWTAQQAFDFMRSTARTAIAKAEGK